METYVAIALVIGVALIVFYYRKRKSRKNECPAKEESKEGSDVSQKEENAVSQGENIEVHSDKTVNVPTEFPVYWFDENGNKVEGVAKMAQGMQVFDANGKIRVDVTSRLQKYLGKFKIDGTQSSGSIINSELVNGDLWYFFLASTPNFTAKDTPRSVPTITKSGDTLTWKFSNGAIPCTLVYGVY